MQHLYTSFCLCEYHHISYLYSCFFLSQTYMVNNQAFTSNSFKILLCCRDTFFLLRHFGQDQVSVTQHISYLKANK